MSKRERGPQNPSLDTWRAPYRKTQAAGSVDCPAPERLAELVLGQLAGSEQDRVPDHVVSCHRCTAAVRNLIDLRKEADPLLASG